MSLLCGSHPHICTFAHLHICTSLLFSIDPAERLASGIVCKAEVGDFHVSHFPGERELHVVAFVPCSRPADHRCAAFEAFDAIGTVLDQLEVELSVGRGFFDLERFPEFVGVGSRPVRLHGGFARQRVLVAGLLRHGRWRLRDDDELAFRAGAFTGEKEDGNAEENSCFHDEHIIPEARYEVTARERVLIMSFVSLITAEN